MSYPSAAAMRPFLFLFDALKSLAGAADRAGEFIEAAAPPALVLCAVTGLILLGSEALRRSNASEPSPSAHDVSNRHRFHANTRALGVDTVPSGDAELESVLVIKA